MLIIHMKRIFRHRLLLPSCSLGVVIGLLLSACSVGYHVLDQAEVIYMESNAPQAAKVSILQDRQRYVPEWDKPYKTPLRRIRTQVVFMDDSLQQYNLQGEAAVDFAQKLIRSANRALATNHPMNLPLGNQAEVFPINWRYELFPDPRSAVRFVQDDDRYYVVKGRQQYDRAVIQSYSQGLDSVLHIYIMPHHPDSMRSRTYGALGTGIALGHAIKLNGDFLRYPEEWRYVGTLNHELGHVLGLSHSWRYDACDDTPEHPNCWEQTDGPPCDSLYSNNMMDYNNKQEALTPCQLAIANYHLAYHGARQRRLLLPDYCLRCTDDDLLITDSVQWYSDMDICQDVVVTKGAVLTVSAQLRLAQGCAIYVDRGAGLRLLGDGELCSCQGVPIQQPLRVQRGARVLMQSDADHD